MYKDRICSCLAVISDSVCATFEVCCLANCTTKNIKNDFWHAELNFEICNSSPLQSGQLNSESTFTHSLTIAPEKWWCFCVTIFISVKHWLIFVHYDRFVPWWDLRFLLSGLEPGLTIPETNTLPLEPPSLHISYDDLLEGGSTGAGNSHLYFCQQDFSIIGTYHWKCRTLNLRSMYLFRH